ncbi:MAG TPA: CPBP family intramembrane metalloprotease [Gordonia sp. (in: high G+C Gram-positive bacteria)]|uniref:CPBP family intramembrane glutamic endopeptidase n=2 Tax=unclassified Gordonia (in: high G+C Gram-positive bacteria) TaxID=2657482 RepID=UPI000FB37D36|nr:CPBP family intramembrane glutamic endopeptidase [Gordonia sp. (in: high G+C Gram-positive bacteria)]RUP40734.1 MAG: CPBP family intramembrane metalloprotease [Gordonia sp. (in: high G+C Gram-positive bacteria)]HNP58019.1 CPBP family intramembrane metalloprotease [Gordonia sp. (in: high G+C Gram-positive bacteria)]HRC52427.1 CPBP family intramembrane metalloprotease [Gordonia sp. (in: high G+C Gram-positive bacteria)]
MPRKPSRCGPPVLDSGVSVVTDPVQRRALWIELAIVGVMTFGSSALLAILALVEAQLTGGIDQTTVALNPSRSDIAWIDAARQAISVVRLAGMAVLAGYLLWRSGIRLTVVGLTRRPARGDVPYGLGLAALIGLPGLGLVVLAHAVGMNAALVPGDTDGPWWQIPMLIAIAIGNAVAEEVVVVAYLLVRLRQLGLRDASALASSALLRGSYHLYQGIGGGLGNVVMGLVFGRFYQRTGRLWPLVIAHAVIDVVAFVGFLLIGDRLGISELRK